MLLVGLLRENERAHANDAAHARIAKSVGRMARLALGASDLVADRSVVAAGEEVDVAGAARPKSLKGVGSRQVG